MKRITMIAGPNGAGKTTMAFAVISDRKEIYEEFLNADEIARGLSPLHPEGVNFEAGKLMIKRFHSCLDESKNFIFETTASGLSYATHLKKAKAKGYEINLLFLWLSGPEQAVKRVALRVRQGGHNIPEDAIIRRYYRGLNNLVNFYFPISDTAVILDNSFPEFNAKVIARKERDSRLFIEDEESWKKIQRAANVRIG